MINLKLFVKIASVIFLLMYILNQILGMCLYTSYYADSNLYKTVFRIRVVIGFLIIAYDLLNERYIFKSRHCVWLWIMLVMETVSIISMHRYGLIDNVKIFIHHVEVMMVLYILSYRCTRDEEDFLIRFLYIILSVIFVPVYLYDIIRFLSLEHYIVNYRHYGWHEGRLFGIMSPMYAQTAYAVILLILTMYMLYKNKKLYHKLIYGFEIIILSLYIALSDTRSIFSGIIISLGYIVFALYRKRILQNKDLGSERKSGYIEKFKSVLIGIGIFSIALILIYELRLGIRNGWYLLSDYFYNTTTVADDSQLNEVVNESDSYNELRNESDNDNELRNEGDNYNGLKKMRDYYDRPKDAPLSNGRVDIWKCYIKIILDNPRNLLLGLSPAGMREYVWEKYPDCFIIEAYKLFYPERYERKEIYGAHNALLYVLASTGIIGLIGILGFIVRCAADVLSNTYKGTASDRDIVFAAIVICILTAIMFEQDVILGTSGISCIFWFLAGILMKEIDKKKFN